MMLAPSIRQNSSNVPYLRIHSDQASATEPEIAPPFLTFSDMPRGQQIAKLLEFRTTAATAEQLHELVPLGDSLGNQVTTFRKLTLQDLLEPNRLAFGILQSDYGSEPGTGVFSELARYVGELRGEYLTVNQLIRVEDIVGRLSIEIGTIPETAARHGTHGIETETIPGRRNSIDALLYSLHSIRHQLVLVSTPIKRGRKFEYVSKRIQSALQQTRNAEVNGAAQALVDALARRPRTMNCAMLAELWFRLDALESAISCNRSAVNRTILPEVSGMVSELLGMSATAWNLPNRPPLVEPNSTPAQTACCKAYRGLISSLRQLRAPFQALGNAEYNEIITQLLKELASDLDQPDPRALNNTKIKLAELRTKLADDLNESPHFKLWCTTITQLEAVCDAIQLSRTDDFNEPLDTTAHLITVLDDYSTVLGGKGTFEDGWHSSVAKLRLIVSSSEPLSGQAWSQIESLLDELSVLIESRADDGELVANGSNEGVYYNLPISFIKGHAQHVRDTFNRLRPTPPEARDPIILKSKRGFFTLLKSLKSVLIGFDDAAYKHVRIALQRFAASDAEPTQKEWATTSLEMEKVLHLLKKNPLADNYIHNGRTLGSVRKAIAHLEFLSRYAWAEQSYKHITEAATNYYTTRLNPAYSESTVTAGSAGLRFGLPFTAKSSIDVDLGLEYRHATMMDDEGYPGQLSGLAGSASASADLVFVHGNTKFTSFVGKFLEWCMPQDYVLTQFKKVVNELSESSILSRLYAWLFRPAPDIETVARRNISAHLNRSSTPTLSTLFAPAAEIADFDNLKLKYELQKDHITRFFSLFNRTESTQAPSITTTDPSFSLAAPDVPIPKSVLKADANVETSAGSASVGLSNHMTQLDGAALDLGSNFLVTPSAGFDVSYQKSTLTIPEHTPLCEKLQQTENSGEAGLILRTRIRDQLERVTNPLGTIAAQVPTAEYLIRHAMLTEDFKHYSGLQCQVAYGDATTIKSIEAFHKLYNARNKEECLARMMIKNAWIYSRVMDQIEIPGLDAVKVKALQLEKTMREAVFSYDQDKIKQLVSIKQTFEISTEDVRIGCSLRAQLGWSGMAATAATLTASAMVRIRKHLHIFRAGQYADFTVHLEAGLDISNLKGALGAVANRMKDHEKTMQFAASLSDYLTQTPSENLPALPVDISRGYDVTIRCYKPEKFKLSPRVLYMMVTKTKVNSSALKGAIPVLPGINVTAGGSHVRISTDLVNVSYSPRTILYFGLRYLHEMGSGNGNQVDGSVPDDSYWATILREQESALKQLFNNVALDRYVHAPDGLIAEMEEIESVLATDKTGVEHAIITVKLAVAKQRFILAAAAYSYSDPETKTQNYAAALKSFENLLLAYHPQVTQKKRDYPRTAPEILTQMT